MPEPATANEVAHHGQDTGDRARIDVIPGPIPHIGRNADAIALGARACSSLSKTTNMKTLVLSFWSCMVVRWADLSLTAPGGSGRR
jgi:hypothetical protein